ncbi:MAG: 50S ribosomal protein L9 [Bdellovibrionales bacterium]
MKVILNQDVKNLGKIGEMVQVKPGFARNFLFPRRMASEATEKRVKEFKHLQLVAEAKQAKAVEGRKEVLAKIQGETVQFQVEAAEDEQLFGSIGALDISRKLEEAGFAVDKRDVVLEDVIKVLGQHKAKVVLGKDLEAEITVAVERKVKETN